jgi:quercetin dioxygenase-like cupin family protein
MDKETLKQKLTDEGFLHVYEWHDKPGTEYPAHAHKGAVSMYILDGGLTFWFGQEEKILKEGDRFDVPVGKEHTAKVGEYGCTFLVGEMIDGDS